MDLRFFKKDETKTKTGVWLGVDFSSDNYRLIEVETEEDLPRNMGFKIMPVIDMEAQLKIEQLTRRVKKKHNIKEGDDLGDLTVIVWLDIVKATLSEVIIQDWRGIDLPDEANLPYSKENAARLIDWMFDNDVQILVDNLYKFATNKTNFLLKEKYKVLDNVKKN